MWVEMCIFLPPQRHSIKYRSWCWFLRIWFLSIVSVRETSRKSLGCILLLSNKFCFTYVCYNRHNGWIHPLYYITLKSESWLTNYMAWAIKSIKPNKTHFLSLHEFACIMQCTTGHFKVTGFLLQKVNNITQEI